MRGVVVSSINLGCQVNAVTHIATRRNNKNNTKITHRCPEVVAAALEGVWRKLMSAPSPDWSKVSEVVRRLLQQAGSDGEKLRLYR